MSTPAPSSPPDPEPLRFSIAGQVTVWDPIYRHLEIGTRTFEVAPSVSVTRLAVGTTVTVIGHQDNPTGRAIVTTLRFD